MTKKNNILTIVTSPRCHSCDTLINRIKCIIPHYLTLKVVPMGSFPIDLHQNFVTNRIKPKSPMIFIDKDLLFNDAYETTNKMTNEAILKAFEEKVFGDPNSVFKGLK